MAKLEKIIITGSQGTGKSSLLKYMKKDFYIAEEVSRQVIIEQQNNNTTAMPWLNVEKYSKLVFELMINQYQSQKSSICIYDRAIPDVITYLKLKNKQVPDIFYEASEKYLKGSKVFFAPLWEEIYVTDLQRPEAYGETVIISKMLKETYKDLGFEIINLKKESIQNRSKFVNSFF